MNRDKARIAVYALGGLYLLYLAWQMFQGLPTAGSEKPLMIGFLIFLRRDRRSGHGWLGVCIAAGRRPADEVPEPKKQNRATKSRKKLLMK